MIFLNEDDAKRLITPSQALQAVQDVFVSMSENTARNFAVVREKLPEVGGTFGVKSAADLAHGVVGLKTGGYWPGNDALGIKNHQSMTLICNAHTGEPAAVVAANYLTGLRTAAASAVATRALARTDVATLSVIGTGAQALHQIEAQAGVRPFTRLLVAGRDRQRAEALADAARQFIANREVVDFEQAAREADVLLTLTPATSPIVQDDWVRPGTHINAVGADTIGKGEIDPALLKRARVFYDDWTQASTIGECQKAVAKGYLVETSAGGTLGDVIRGLRPGRASDLDITLFDSSGVALQDLAVARIAVASAKARTRDDAAPRMN